MYEGCDLLSFLYEKAKGRIEEMPDGIRISSSIENIYYNCDTMFSYDEAEYVKECFETISSLINEREKLLYVMGIKDGIDILKITGAIT